MSEPARRAASERFRVNLAVIAFTLVLIIGGVWLAKELKRITALEDCVMQGRRNCAPIP